MDNMQKMMEDLALSCQKIEKNAQNSISWVRENSQANCVKSQAASVERILTEVEVKARSIKNISSKPCSIGVFGQSQAGKSYLVSCLAGDERSDLITKLGDTTYNFIRDINPPGGGKEATGLVTRFTIHNKEDGKAEYPVKVELLKEVEIALVLINSYFNDSFETPTIQEKKIEAFRDTVNNLRDCGQEKRKFIDEVIILKQYLSRNHRELSSMIDDNIWAMALKKIPKADIDERAKFYSFFWGENDVLTTCFKKMANILGLINSTNIYLQLSSLITKGQSGVKSIINVTALNSFSDKDVTLKYMRPDNSCGEAPLSFLAALIAELNIPIINAKYQEKIFTKLDLLDFPGYRGRLHQEFEKLTDNDFTNCNNESRALVPELFLRGKVGYLFEKYVDNNDLNCLIVCTAADGQLDAGIEGVVDRWVKETQGSNPEERKQHKPGLYWVLTKFDNRIGNDLGKDNISYGSEGLLGQTLFEKFSRYEWLNNWDGDNEGEKPQSFNNLFLIRKLNQESCTFIELSSGKPQTESNYTNKKAKVDELREKFINDKDVKKFFKDPKKSWDRVVALNDGGIELLCESISFTDADNIRYQSLSRKVGEMAYEGKKQIADWYTSEDNAENQKQKQIMITKIFRDQNPEIGIRFGELLSLFNLPEAQIKEAYNYDINEAYFNDLDNAAQEASKEEETQSVDDFNLDALFNEAQENIQNSSVDIGSSSNKGSDVAVSGFKCKEAGRIFNAWIRYLTNFTCPITKIDQKYVDFFISEIKAYVERINFAKTFDEKMDKVLGANSKGRDQVYAQALVVASNTISDFLIGIGGEIDKKNEEENLENGYPVLDEDAPDYNKILRDTFNVWFKKFAQESLKNSNVSRKTGISLEQNKILGNYIALFKEEENKYKNER